MLLGFLPVVVTGFTLGRFSDGQVGVCVSRSVLRAHADPPLFRDDSRVAAETWTATWKTHMHQTSVNKEEGRLVTYV